MEITRKAFSPFLRAVVQRGPFPLPTQKGRSVCEMLEENYYWLIGSLDILAIRLPNSPALVSSSARLTDTGFKRNVLCTKWSSVFHLRLKVS